MSTTTSTDVPVTFTQYIWDTYGETICETSVSGGTVDTSSLTQSEFSRYFTEWLTLVFNNDLVQQFLAGHGYVYADNAFTVSIQQNSGTLLPTITIGNVTVDNATLDALFVDKELVQVATGKTTQDRWYVDVVTLVSNHAPIAVDDIGTAGENETKSFDVLANDTDTDLNDTKTLVSLGAVTVTSGNAAVNGIAGADGAFSIVGNQLQFSPGTKFDALAAGETAEVVVNYTMRDTAGATSSAKLTLTVTGVNDAATIVADGAQDRAVTEAGYHVDGDGSAGGKLKVTDVDSSETFQDPASLDGTYGSFTFDKTTGAWTYALDDTRDATNALKQDEPVTDTLTVTSADGTASYDIVVNITGTNDQATIAADGTQDTVVVEAGYQVDGDGSAGGKLKVTDVDSSETFQDPASLDGTYGSFTFDKTTGAWTYALDDARDATNALKQDQAVTDTLTVTSADGTATYDIVVNITGSNDAATIAADGTQDTVVVEAGVAIGGDALAGGKLKVTDVDSSETFQDPASLDGTYGSFTFDKTTGAWTYALDDARDATNALKQDQAVTDTLTVTSADGTATYDIVVNITGSNDQATIAADGTQDTVVVEAGYQVDGDGSAGGKLKVTDVDSSETFQDPASLDGTYGSFTFDKTTGAWTYALDDARDATNALKQDQAVTDTLTVTSADGTATYDIVVNITGTNDQATIAADGTQDTVVVEAGVAIGGDALAGGKLKVTDVDSSETFQDPASLDGTYGSFTFDKTTGAWTYALDDARDATNALKQDQAVTDTLTVTSADGTATYDIVVNITGSNDAATITANGPQDTSVVEAGTDVAGDPSAGGDLNVADPDTGESAFAPMVVGPIARTYGNFTFNSGSGAWTYTLNDNDPDTQALRAGQAASDTLTVHSLDGTASYDIVVNITGSNDAALIGDPSNIFLVEDSGVDANGKLVASGTIGISDVDAGEASFRTTVTPVGEVLGALMLAADGTYTYSVDNSAVQFLPGAENWFDFFTITSLDGTTKDVGFLITGVNDAPTPVADVVYISTGATAKFAASVFLADDYDVDSAFSDLSIEGVVPGSSSPGLTVSLGADGIFTVTTGGLSAGSYSFQYILSDGVDTAAGTVTVNLVGFTGGGDTLDLSSTPYDASWIDMKNGADSAAAGTSTLNGGAIDYFVGGDGNDSLNGSVGADTIQGGKGIDTIDLGVDSAADIVVLTGIKAAADGDTIAHFNVAQDKILLSTADTTFADVAGAATVKAFNVPQSSGTTGNLDVLNFNVFELAFDAGTDADLGSATIGGPLLDAASTGAVDILTGFNVTGSGNNRTGYILAYDAGNAYLYFFDSGNGSSALPNFVSADEIQLIATFTSVAVGALGASNFEFI